MMGIYNREIKKWLWLLYPVCVLGFVVFSVNFLFGGDNRVGKYMERRSVVDDEQVRISRLKEKLAALSQVSLDETTKDYQETIEAVPLSKKVWMLLAELRSSASESGLILNNYKGQSGEVKEASESATSDPNLMRLEAEFGISSFDQFEKLVQSLERYIPLVKIVRAEYTGKKMSITVQGAYANLIKVAQDIENPLPDYRTDRILVKGKLADLVKISEAAVISDTGSSSASPF